nr:hypothetical protein CFP56_12220 [Quercus suber]
MRSVAKTGDSCGPRSGEMMRLKDVEERWQPGSGQGNASQRLEGSGRSDLVTVIFDIEYDVQKSVRSSGLECAGMHRGCCTY